MINLELEEKDVLKLVAILIQTEVISDTYFENHEPIASDSKRISQDILGQAVANGLIATQGELNEHTHEMNVSGLKING